MDNKIFTLLVCLVISSCGGERTFHDYARAGDTVAVSAGMQPTFNKDNITITITPAIGAPIVLTASDPAIRAVINLYPDPLSNMIISHEIQEDTSPAALGYSNTMLFITNNEKAYFQTTVFIDIPVGLATGLAQIKIADGAGTSFESELNIIEGTGSPNPFNAEILGSEATFNLDAVMRDTLARAPHTEVTFNSNVIPHAIEINFTHDPDNTAGGLGKAFVVNPLGHIKNLSWSDDGTNLKIILLQATDNIITDMKDYKFYIAGTITNLQLSTTDAINAYDNNGNDSANIVVPTLTLRN